MLIERLVINELYTNTYVVGEPGGAVMILDPGDEEMTEVIEFVREHDLRVVSIVNSHAHYDHVLGNERMRDLYGVPLYLHERDVETLLQLPHITKSLFGSSVPSRAPDRYLRDGDVLEVGSYRFRVLETPGHTPGCVCLYEEREDVLFTGDTLFAGTIGRTDLPGGDIEQLMQSLQYKIWPLPDRVAIYPGHEEESTIGEERMHNPYFHFS